MKSFITLLFIVFFSYTLLAKNVRVKGRILDPTNKPLVYSNIVLLSPIDSSIVVGTTSNQNGKFELKTQDGNYILRVSFLTYENYYQSLFLENNIDLGDISLKAKDIKTGEVNVTADRTLMEFDLDKRVVNVSADLNNRGKTAQEILDNIPSVSVDVEGEVNLRGSNNVRLLIDGKPSGIIGRDPEQLRQLMGENIEKIEVITNPSARYDAEGEVGIINIVLKKNKKYGYNGSFDISGGYPNISSISLNSNYRYSFINLFTTIGVNYRKFPGRANGLLEYTEPDSIVRTITERRQERGGLGSNIRLGSDIFFNEKNILTASFYYRYGDRNNVAEITYEDYFLNDPVFSSYRNDNEGEESNNIEFDLTYKSEFEKEDHVLTFTTKFIQDEDLELSNLDQGIAGSNPDLIQQSSNLEFERIFLLQGDFVYPFWDGGKLELGTKLNQRKIDNKFSFESLENDSWIPISGLNDNFLYYENIYAAYILTGYQWDRFSIQGGLRYEYSDITTELTDSNYRNPRDYSNFFPTMHSSYKFSKHNSMQLSYSRRINRPRFRELMPISSFSDTRNFYMGNPDLDPVFSNAYQFSFLREKNTFTLLTSAYASRSKGLIQRLTFANSDGTTSISPLNIGEKQTYGFELNISYDPFKWVRLNTNMNFFRLMIEGNEAVGNEDSDNLTWQGKFNSRFKTGFGLDFQVNLSYFAPQDLPQGRIKEIWFVDLAGSMDLFDKKASLTISGRDIFSTRLRRMTMIQDDFFFDQDFQWRSGQIVVSFNYQFKKI